MDRRQFLLTSALGTGMIASPILHSAKNDMKKPNIIYILVDDMGYGDLGCYGQKTLKTPHIDRMAQQGIKFTRHYSGSTVCAPSRCVLITGLHTGHCRIRSNGKALLKDDDTTIGKILKKAGYKTGCIGKWGVGNPPPDNDPERCGFDYFYGYIKMHHAHNFFPEFLVRNGKREKLQNVLPEEWKEKTKGNIAKEGGGVSEKKIDYAPELLQKDAIKFIEQNRNQPFFLYYALNIPHANNEGGNTPDGMEVPSYGEFASRNWPDNEKGFATMIKFIDNGVEEIIQKLREIGLDKNTIVIFTSDNGPHEEGGHEMEFFNSNGQLRGFKRDLYEGGIRVPFIAYWPGKIKKGAVSNHISGFQDMMETFSNLAGTKCPANDGISMLPVLLGKKSEQKKHKYLYWEFHGRGGKQAIVMDDWKGVKLNFMKNPDSPIELYNLKNDISEQNNIAGKHSDIVKKIEGFMKEAHIELEK